MDAIVGALQVMHAFDKYALIDFVTYSLLAVAGQLGQLADGDVFQPRTLSNVLKSIRLIPPPQAPFPE